MMSEISEHDIWHKYEVWHKDHVEGHMNTNRRKSVDEVLSRTQHVGHR